MGKGWIWAMAIGLLLLGGRWRAEAGPAIFDLTKLERVCLVALVSPAAKDLGLSKEAIGNRVYVWMKSKIPKLQVEFPAKITCTPFLLVIVEMAKRGEGYFGHVSIDLIRSTRWKSGKVGEGIAYTDGTILRGPVRSAGQHVTKILDELVTNFAAEYYKAGNP